MAVVKVNVYDAQAQALDQAQPRTVERLVLGDVTTGQPGDELIDARHGGEYHFDLFFGEDVGQVFGFFGAEGINRARVYFEYFVV